jgi:hypothetical protein
MGSRDKLTNLRAAGPAEGQSPGRLGFTSTSSPSEFSAELKCSRSGADGRGEGSPASGLR